jgi:hypothetical protein
MMDTDRSVSRRGATEMNAALVMGNAGGNRQKAE